MGDSEAIKELEMCRALKTLDLSGNRLEGEAVLDVIVAIPELLSFTLVGNPVMETPQVITMKILILSIPMK